MARTKPQSLLQIILTWDSHLNLAYTRTRLFWPEFTYYRGGKKPQQNQSTKQQDKTTFSKGNFLVDFLIPVTPSYFPKSGLNWREKIQAEGDTAFVISADSWMYSSPEGKVERDAITWPQQGLVLGRCQKPRESSSGGECYGRHKLLLEVLRISFRHRSHCYSHVPILCWS